MVDKPRRLISLPCCSFADGSYEKVTTRRTLRKMSRIAQILLSVKRQLAFHGATVEEMINEFDRYRSGSLTPDQLQRALNRYDVSLSRQDLQELIIEVSERGMIINRKLIQAVHQVSETDIQQADHSSCDALLRLHKFLSIRQVSLSDLMQPYDRLKRGLIPSNEFVRALNSKEGEIIAKEYVDKRTDMIRYAQIERDMEIAVSKDATKKLTIPESVRTIVSQIVARRGNIRDAFTAMDRVRCGKVTPQQFVSVLIQMGVTAPQQMMRETLEFYRDDLMVQYLPIVDEVEKEHSNQKLARDEMVMTKSSGIVNTNVLIERIKTIYVARRVNVTAMFAPVCSKEGFIRKYAFLKVLAQSGADLTSDELNALADRFEVSEGVVDSKRFIAFFEKETSAVPAIDAKLIIKRIKEHLTAHKMSLRKLIEKIDRTDSGEIISSQLLICLQNSGIQFRSGEFEVFQREYETSPGVIAWRRVCNDVDNDEFYTRTVAPAPQKEETKRVRPVIQPPTGTTAAAVAKMAEAVRKASVDIHEDFRVLDRRGQGYVSYSDFMREMISITNAFPVNDLKEVFQHYANGGVNFDYVSFTRDIKAAPVPAVSETASSEARKALRRYRAYIISRRLEAADIFRRFDPKATGFIGKEYVPTALRAMEIKLTDKEIAVLIEAFTDKVFPERISYRALDQAASQEKMDVAEIRILLNPQHAEEERVREIGATLCEIKQKLKSRHRTFAMIFSGVATATIPVREFFDRLLDYGIILKGVQKEALISKYADEAGAMLNWKQLVQESESSVLIGSV